MVDTNKVLSQGPALNNGITMPWLGLGVYKAKDGEEVVRAIQTAAAVGYRSIDTARIYANEEGVGKGIRESGVPRDEWFITTKVWATDEGYETTLQAFEASRKRLGLEIIDLYLVHWPVRGMYRDTWKALVHLYQEGAVRAIGVSNFEIDHMEEIIGDTGVIPSVNQVELQPLLTRKSLLAYANAHNIRLTAWSPLMRGRFNLPLISELAQKYRKTNAQIILRWDIQNGIIVIPKSVNPERMLENSQIFDFEISPEDMHRIDALDQDKHLGDTVELINEKFAQ